MQHYIDALPVSFAENPFVMLFPDVSAERMGIESTKTKYVGKVPAPVFTCCSWVNKYALKVSECDVIVIISLA